MILKGFRKPLKPPTVTVYIPTKNRVDLLKRAATSVLQQTHTEIELIIVDDYSTDRTKQYLQKLSRENINVRVFYNRCNQGACFSRNLAISNASGEFITGLDDDDYFTPDRVSNFLEAWPNKAAGTIALCSLRKFIKTPFDIEKAKRKNAYLIHQDEIFIRNCIGNQIFTTTQLAQNMSGFDHNLFAWQDLEFFIRVLSYGNIENTFACTYIVDDSHLNNRISTQNFDRIKYSCAYIIEKHSLKGRNKNRLESQLLDYNFTIKNFIKCVANSVVDHDIRALKATCMRALRTLMR